MARLENAYTEGDNVVFEMAVTAFTEAGAKTRGATALIGRRPGHATAVESIEALQYDDGVAKQYRVIITLNTDEDLRSLLKIDEALESLERLL
jgi:hypothetical protein